MSDMKADLILDVRAQLGEGPVWHPREQRLYWVDILAGLVHVHDPSGKPDTVYRVGQMVGAAVPRRSGGLMLATQTGLGVFDLATERFTLVAAPEKELPENRFNDGKCDPRGRFWAGTMSMVRKTGTGSLYCLDTDGTVRHVFGGVTTSNGLGWSPDQRTMYYIDTPTMQVAAFDYDAEAGTLSNRRVIIPFPDGVGRPDGMTVDAEGMLWIAHWDGGRVSRWEPATGRLLQEIHLPVARASSCTFGGPNLERLYITTARTGLTEDQLREQPHAGSLFAATPGVVGLPADEYAG
ncbi:MAG: SMP-30/gluconolactonase/LRE family protein [Candidatus Anammoximicrobium sp.]|nr:SMP-30/gluconolactonase/LRE family protein [Candidatus Anammoximicrobium sp.]